jgi:hypothetical protein
MKREYRAERDRLNAGINLLTEAELRLKAQLRDNKRADQVGIPTPARDILRDAAIRLGDLARALPRHDRQTSRPPATPPPPPTTTVTDISPAAAKVLSVAFVGRMSRPSGSLDDAVIDAQCSRVPKGLMKGSVRKAGERLSSLARHPEEVASAPPRLKQLYEQLNLGDDASWKVVSDTLGKWGLLENRFRA